VDSLLTAQQPPLDDAYTSAVMQGQRESVSHFVAQVVSGARGIEILTENGRPVVHLVFSDHSVPAALAGDGLLAVLRLVVALASSPGGVVLLEEPEVHEHPGAIRQSAKAIVAAVRRDIQVILSTHSLELIDALLAEAYDKDLDKLAVYRLQLKEGLLKSHRIAGPDVHVARTQIEDDLR